MEITIKTSLIDYIGECNSGVSIAITLTLENDFTFEAIYWIHPDGQYILEPEDDFLKLFGVQDSKDLPFIKELIVDIDSILEDKEEIFKAFLDEE